VDPSKLQGRPTSYVDGFIRFVIPSSAMQDVLPDGTTATCNTTTSTRTNNMLVFSYVDSNVIGAAQTMLAGEGTATLLP
ncbi:MAG: hypothetical protein ACPL2F_02170, partial [Dissulfurimicrobium hydrothermale]